MPRTVPQLAHELYNRMETKTRTDGSEYVSVRNPAPWMTDTIREAHGDMLPDDYRYAMIQSFLAELSSLDDDDGEEAQDELIYGWADAQASIHNMARFEWLASNLYRQFYCDEAREEGLVDPDDGISQLIAAGWYMEAREVANSVLLVLRKTVAEEADEDEESE